MTVSIPTHAPRFTDEEALGLVKEFYGFDGTMSPLPSERDQNFLLERPDGRRFVLKIANAREDAGLLEAQQRAMSLVASRTGLCPRVIPGSGGGTLFSGRAADGRIHPVWLIEWLPGRLFARVKYRSGELLEDLGRSLARLDLTLAGFHHPALDRELDWNLEEAGSLVLRHIGLIEDSALRRSIDILLRGYVDRSAPLVPRLRRQTIYNDANDFNILVDDRGRGDNRFQKISGFVDFGDMLTGPAVFDLAVAAAYALLETEDPLAAASAIVKGYHSQIPLGDADLASLFGLIALRLSLSAVNAARQHQASPRNDYLLVSQPAVRSLLPRLAALPPGLAEASFRQACGLVPCPRQARVTAWLEERRADLAPVFPAEVMTGRPLVLDLSVSSPLVSGDEKENDEPGLSRRIAAALDRAGARWGIGRHLEARGLYTTPLFAGEGHPLSERRTVHLGMDLFAPAGTPVCAPLAGTLEAKAERPGNLDYGGLVMLRHQADDGSVFFSLYGHLRPSSLTPLPDGAAVPAGEILGCLGIPSENGGWTPHLHLQLILDDLGLGTAFPGVARASQRPVWAGLCPDPNLLLGVSPSAFPEPPPDKEATLTLRRKWIGLSLGLSYREPIKMVRGFRQYLFDDEGRRYLDAYNNVPHVGHCHPRVIEAVEAQLRVLNTNTRYLHDNLNRYAERLCSLLPEPLRVCYVLNSASEANELALRLARTFTGRRDMIVLEGAYHGHTTSLIDISPYKHAGPGGRGAPDWVHVAPVADGYRGPYRSEDPRAGEKYAAHVAGLLDALKVQGRGPAGFIAESCPSVGGQIFFPPGYLDNVYRAVREAGGLCIADEVQTGLGRLGTHFWGFELQGVVPDVVVLGKPIGNGFPLAAVVTRPEVARAFANGMEFFSTYGGNPVACAAGLAVLDVLEDEKLPEHAARVGERLLAGLKPLAGRHPLVGDVRGQGLFLGLEFVRDRGTLEPAAAEAGRIVNRLRERGILLGTDGPLHNVIKIRPPMPFDLNNADLLVGEMDRVLEEDFGE
jgi:4-aminobutyrate aminotransferase-like enzyme/Ser/Thr protein kinase RdoA (MazF antagonist)